MYIQPNSEIKILRNVGFNNSYSDTVYFASLSEQTTYFNALVKYTLTAQYYCRVNNGVLKVEKPIQDLQDCNYMMFRNISFGGKWFYAFITKVEYVNNETSKIEFEIDSLQTYFFDVTLRQCFVEREHSATDAIGDNLQDEPFQIEDYVYQYLESVEPDLDECVILVAYARNYTVGQRIKPYSVIDNTIQCVDLFAYSIDQTGALNLGIAIDEIVGRNMLDNIIDIYAVPRIACPTLVDSGANQNLNYNSFLDETHAISDQAVGYADNYSITNINDTTPFTDVKGGAIGTNYYPRNLKLYTYPYCCFELSSSMGEKAQYAFEDFDSSMNIIYLTLMCTITNPVQVSLYPCYYKRIAPDTIERVPLNTEGALTIANYSKSAFSSDAFRAWMAQNSVPMVIETLLAGAAGAGVGFVEGGPVGAVVGGISAVGATGTAKAIQAYKVTKTSDHTRGSINNGNNLHAHGAYLFNKAMKHIPNQIAKIIDDHFTMYGYACNEVKYPNRHVRAKYTYTKTRGSNVQGRCPQDDIVKINSIYDNGIRFWSSDATIGYYGTFTGALTDRNYNAPLT